MGHIDGSTEQFVLRAWEEGQGVPALERGLLLLRLAQGEASVDFASESVGRRDSALIRLRCSLYGDHAPCFLECPACAAELESALDLRQLDIAPPSDGHGPFSLKHDAWTLRFRLPTTVDLVALSDAASSAQFDPRQVLVGRILQSAESHGDGVAFDRIPPEVLTLLEAELDRLDPVADLRLSQECPECAHVFEAPFDIGAFLWRELDVHARRVLQQVDILARNYGWTEPDILSLSARRRRTYLQLCGAY